MRWMPPAFAAKESLPTRSWLFPAIITLCFAAAYSSSFGGVFVRDDKEAIGRNSAIRSLWPPWHPLVSSAKEIATAGRPVLTWTFAVNCAVHGLETAGFYLANMVVHICSAPLLYGIGWRTLTASGCGKRSADLPQVLGFTIALL